MQSKARRRRCQRFLPQRGRRLGVCLPLLGLRWMPISNLVQLAPGGTRKQLAVGRLAGDKRSEKAPDQSTGEPGKEPKMGSEGQNLGEELSNQLNDALSRLATKQMFQSDWDIAAFAIFFIFIGTVLLLVLLALIRCCCCCDCDSGRSHKQVPRKKVGIDNKAMEP